MMEQTKCRCGRPLGEDKMWAYDDNEYRCGICWRRGLIVNYSRIIADMTRHIAVLRSQMDELEKVEKPLADPKPL